MWTLYGTVAHSHGTVYSIWTRPDEQTGSTWTVTKGERPHKTAGAWVMLGELLKWKGLNSKDVVRAAD